MHPQFSPLTVQWFYRAYVYTGSIGEFRYRYARDKDAGLIHAAVYSHYCYESARDTVQQDFPWTEAGVAALQQWMQSQLDTFTAEGRFLPAKTPEDTENNAECKM